MKFNDPKACASEYMANVMGHPAAKIVDSLRGRNDEHLVLFDNDIALVVTWYPSTESYDVWTETSIEDFNRNK